MSIARMRANPLVPRARPGGSTPPAPRGGPRGRPGGGPATGRSVDARIRSRVAGVLPRGRRLPDEIWKQRHGWLVFFLLLHAPVLFLFATYRGYSLLAALGGIAPILIAGGLALSPPLGRAGRSACVALGLLTACSVLVAFSGGAIEAHFHYFVVIAFLSLYQEWMPFLIAIGFVLVEHGVIGILDPSAVYDHPGMAGMPAMAEHPWRWAFIHAGFVLAASVANLLAWRLTEHEALHDGLTGLPNRVLFLDSVRLATERPDAGTTAVLFVDLDNFKDANDAFGHDTGNDLLRVITARLLSVARPGDIVARLGGDEFGVIMFGLDGVDGATRAAQRFLDAFTEPFAVKGLSLRSSASIGLVTIVAGRASADEIIRDADLAMYDAKRSGGGRISVFHSDMYDAVVHRANLEVELNQALAREQFVVHYQPLVSVSSGEIVGTEALVRWQHPTRGLVEPGEFISALEESGLITALGRWVMQRACLDTAQWNSSHPDEIGLTISVNLSPRQLTDPHLVDAVASALADSGLAPELLCLEITENAVIKDFEVGRSKLLKLKALGVYLALDDFGTGYCSLGYLRQLPVDSLKIDRSFITDLADDDRIVLAIIDLAHALGMSVTCEGVETEQQLTLLRRMSSNLAQGYLFGAPMTRDALTARLDATAPQP